MPNASRVPATTISVVSHGQGDLVRRLLQDVERHWDTRQLSVILTLNLPETLPFDESRFGFPLRIVRNARPRGFGANHNQAFRLISTDLFCVVNPDIRATRDPLPALRARLMQRRRMALAAPRIYGPMGTVEDSARRLLTPGRILRRTVLRQRGADYHVSAARYLHPDWVAGMFMLIDARAFADIGGFDERYFMYCEDADLCMRLWQRRRGVALLPAGHVVHEARRASHGNLKHLYWHVTSLLRFFLSAPSRRPEPVRASRHGRRRATRLAGRPNRLALLAGSYDPRRDGISVYIENLLLNLLREQDMDTTADMTIEVFACSESIDTLRDVIGRHIGKAAQPIYHRISGRGVLARTCLLSWRVMRSGPFNAVVLPNLQPLPIPGRKLGILHDLTYQVAREHFSRRRFRYMHWLTRMRLRSDEAMGVISETTRMHLLQYYPAARGKRLLLLPNGLPETKLGKRPSRSAVHARLRRQPLQLIFCGRINRLKGMDRLLAFATLLDEQAAAGDGSAPVVHLVGKATPETETILSGLSFRRLELRRHGFLEDEALNRLYLDCAFALFLSRNEGFGLPVIEAIWNGVVPLVSDIPVFAEVLGRDYPRFGSQAADLHAMHGFVERMQDDADYRERILGQMEHALATHERGYRQSARAILAFAAETACSGTADPSAQPLRDSE